MPPPRSPAHCHQPLKGVETTSGASSGRLPAMLATTLCARAWVPYTQMAELRTHPAELNRHERGRKAARAHPRRKPLRRGEIRLSSGAVVSLRVVDLYPSREPLFQRLVP